MARSSRSARNIALLAIVIVTAIVVAVVLGLGDDNSADDTVVTRPSPTTSTSTTTTAPPAPSTEPPPPPIAVPDGDYTAACAELEGPTATYVANPTLAGFRQTLEAFDFDALAAASNDWLRPYVFTLRDHKDQVLLVLASIDDPAQFDPDALPLSFYDALQHVMAVAQQKCGETGG